MRLEWLGTCEPEQQHVCMQLDVLSSTSEVFFFLMVYQYYVHMYTYAHIHTHASKNGKLVTTLWQPFVHGCYKLVTCMVVATLLTRL